MLVISQLPCTAVIVVWIYMDMLAIRAWRQSLVFPLSVQVTSAAVHLCFAQNGDISWLLHLLLSMKCVQIGLENCVQIGKHQQLWGRRDINDNPWPCTKVLPLQQCA